MIEFVHSETILHRDLKLENMLMGVDNSFFQLHLIDFGLSKRYLDPQTDNHIPMKTGKALMGSLEYASINNHNGKELSRRDDLESLGYILCHLLLGDLPWSSLVGEDKLQDCETRILNMKMKFTDSESFKNLPKEFQDFLTTSKSLGFEDEPKYLEYRRDFKTLMIREGYSFDYIYDWILIPVTQQITHQLNAIDDQLELEDTLTQEEQEEIKQLMQKYENDPTVLDFRLEEIRKQNKKFDVVSGNATQGGANHIDDKKGSKGKKGDGESNKKGGKKGEGKNRDCTLI